MKTSLLYHLKQIHNNLCINEEVLGLASSLLKYQGWNISLSPQTTLKSNFWKKMKFKNLSPENHEYPFVLSFKANLMAIHT